MGGGDRWGRGRIAGPGVLEAGSAGSGFRRYPEYRDSGVEWLGEIPAHWEVKRLKTIARVRLSNVDKKTVPGQVPVMLCNYVDVYYNDQIADDIDFMLATATEDQVERFSLRKGDVLITKDSEDPTDIAVPAVVAENLPGVVCGYHLAQMRPNAVCDGSYLARAFVAAGVRDQFSIAANGITRFGLTSRAIGDSVFPLPPIAEQRAIADFLDRESDRIDGLIAKKERLVELLREKRTSLISRAVTRGIDPDAPMKDAGIEWLGEIPVHWEVRRLKALSEMKSGESIASTSIRDSEPYPVFGGNGLRGYTSGFTHDGEHLLIGRQGALCGNVHVARGRFWASEHAVVVSPHHPNSVEWFGALLEAMDLNQYSVAAAQPGLAVDRLRDLQIPVPPDPEKRTIADFLGREIAGIDALVTKVAAATERLNEYRTALISAAVTGIIDLKHPPPPHPFPPAGTTS